MKLRYKFIFFIALIHLIIILLSIKLIGEQKLLFFLVEALILISIAFSFHLYKAFIRPLNLITTGIESIKDQDFNTKFIKVGQLEMDQLIDVYNRMIDQLREERVKQQEQHYFLNLLIEASPSGIIVLSFDDKITSLNPAAGRILGVKSGEVTGKSPTEFDGIWASELSRFNKDENAIISHIGPRAYKCTKAHFLDRGFQRHFILIEELTEEIIKAEKRAYEKVIRMMSHETNNSIGAINSILNSFLNYKDQLNIEDREDFENALTVAIKRNVRLNRFMSNFTDVVRIPPPVRRPGDLYESLKAVHTLLSGECDMRNISWTWELCPQPFRVEFDIQQMEQVLVNACKNAIEAIGENGRITIITSNDPVKRLIIRDTGKGIPNEIRPKLFTPFFSTKKNGQGIGLTLIKEILVNHGYNFSLVSNRQGCTEFTIEFEQLKQY